MNLSACNELDKLEKIREFNKYLIDAAKNNLDNFKYQGKEYLVTAYGEFVQTLINDCILYKIYINEEKNTNELMEELSQYIK